MFSGLGYINDGVNFSMPGNGGPDCLYFISPTRRILETLLTLIISILFIAAGKRLYQPLPKIFAKEEYSFGRIILLISTTFTYGLEFGYKVATKQMIFLLQPCHVIFLIQIIILCWPKKSRFITYLFRFHLFYLHGPICAMVFPDTITLLLPGEVFTYWLEHILLIVTPIYLLKFGGKNCTVEPLLDMSCFLLSLGVYGLFVFVFLGLMSVMFLSNLGSNLCPSLSDPFYGPDWRMWGIGHQIILNFITGKLFSLLGTKESHFEIQDEKKSF